MEAYFDSAIIAKLFCLEVNSADAASLVAGFEPPYVLTHFQMAEVRNALRLKLFRGEITKTQLDRSLDEFDNDVREGRWRMATPDVRKVFAAVEELSAMHSVTLGCRTLDIWHVAAARLMGVKTFASFDQRQRKLAEVAGMNIAPIAP